MPQLRVIQRWDATTPKLCYTGKELDWIIGQIQEDKVGEIQTKLICRRVRHCAEGMAGLGGRQGPLQGQNNSTRSQRAGFSALFRVIFKCLQGRKTTLRNNP